MVNYGERTDNAIFAGLIGLAIIFVELVSSPLVSKDLLNFKALSLFIILFIGVSFFRLYSIVLKSGKLIKWSDRIMRFGIIPLSSLLMPIMFYVQFFLGNIYVFFIVTVIGIYLTNKAVSRANKLERKRITFRIVFTIVWKIIVRKIGDVLLSVEGLVISLIKSAFIILLLPYRVVKFIFKKIRDKKENL